MKPGQNPAGLFAQMQGAGDGEIADFVEHCFRANYSTVSIFNNFGACSRLKDRVPDCDVIYRSTGGEPSPSSDNKKWMADYCKGQPQDKRIRLMVNCENGFTIDRVKAACDYIDVANNEGWKLCVLNTGSGTVKSGQLKGDGTHEVNEWLTIGAPLLHKLAENPEQGLGNHNYTSVFAWIVANGTYMFQKHDKPPMIDWALAQWHMGRDLQGITAACDMLKIGLPLMFITECWVDQMNDIQQNPSNPYHQYKSNRWRDLIEPWKVLYPGVDAEEILATHFQWVWEYIFAKFGRGRVVGMHFFTWLSTALSQNEWAGDNVANAPQYRKRMEAYHPAITSTVPPINPPPIPIPVPPAPTQPPLELEALRMMREHANQVANQTRRISLELAAMSDDLLKDVRMLDVLLKRYE